MWKGLKILIKFPTRSRPIKFFQVLDKYIAMADDVSNIAFLVSIDEDDVTMNNEKTINRLNEYRLLKRIMVHYCIGKSKTKVQAINADLDKVKGQPWHILLLASDDMIPVVQGYDNIIRKDMNDHFRDLDGVLWYNDGGQNRLNTLSVMGKKYFDRFGYIYHPDYISLWCDNEFTDVSLRLKKCYKSDQVIIEHQHPVYEKEKWDELGVKNESFFGLDKETYEKRAARNFDISDIVDTTLFSVLVLSIPDRIKESLSKIYEKLEKQISTFGLQHKIEILALIDNKMRTVGEKRQSLLGISKGKYIAFLDDDDDISDDYLPEIVNAIQSNPEVDVISFNQWATVNNGEKTPVYFGLQYENTEFTQGVPTYRKPFHLCAWNGKLARATEFPNVSITEDWVWVEQLCKKAKTEFHIDKFLHHYIFNSSNTTSVWTR